MPNVKWCILRDAFDLFDEMMKSGLKPDVATYTCLVTGCCRRGNVVKADELYGKMIVEEIVPDERMISAYQRVKRYGILKGKKFAMKALSA